MARDLAAGVQQAMFAEETGETAVELLTVWHPSWAAPERYCGDPTPITSRGHVYAFYPFKVVLPDDTDDTAPMGSISFANVGREVTNWIRRILDAPEVLIEVVRASAPDIVVVAYPRLRLGGVRWPQGSAVVNCALTTVDVSQVAWPADQFTPAGHPGLFA